MKSASKQVNRVEKQQHIPNLVNLLTVAGTNAAITPWKTRSEVG